jgi:thiamine-phosphate pyrophosphorylase
MPDAPTHRCRLVLITPPLWASAAFPARLEAALAGGDVASLVIVQGALGEDAFQAAAAPLVRLAQDAGAAAVVAGDTRIAGRLGADGIHLEGDRAALREAIERFSPRLAVGTGNVKTRDAALELGEERPDYMLFGRFGFDAARPEPHPRNLQLAAWWAEMIDIPAIVMAGAAVASVEAAARTGAEFAALSAAVFAEGLDPQAEVARANAILEEKAPRFAEAEA